MKRHQRKQLRQLKPLSNYDILNLIEKLHIPHFINVFMRDKLPRKKSKLKTKECWILNHGSSQTVGTHWTALTKNHNEAYTQNNFVRKFQPCAGNMTITNSVVKIPTLYGICRIPTIY